MDNISVPSRFSCLKIEDEDFNPAPKLKKKSENLKQNGKKNNLTTNVKSIPKQVNILKIKFVVIQFMILEWNIKWTI